MQRFADCKFRCGESDSGKPLKVSLNVFAEYMASQEDDSPLYVFDDTFGDESRALLDEYTVPPYFTEDLFSYLGDNRPPFRWLLIGPKRSGTSIHQDPLSTSAWNASLSGYKLWAFFPPSLPYPIVKGRGLTLPGEDDEPIFYFRDMLPRIQRKYGVGPFMAVQRPGDVMFAPHHWWHAVLNLSDSIAVTQNFANSYTFDTVWRSVKRQRKKLFPEWKAALEVHRPDLFRRGLALDQFDGE